MADKSTDLTVTDGGSDGALVSSSDMDVESQNPDLEERSASKFDMAV
ncbi:polar flagellar M-ring FliF domain protein, partial [Vibrio parahaemolyticus VPCR-2010]